MLALRLRYAKLLLDKVKSVMIGKCINSFSLPVFLNFTFTKTCNYITHKSCMLLP